MSSSTSLFLVYAQESQSKTTKDLLRLKLTFVVGHLDFEEALFRKALTNLLGILPQIKNRVNDNPV